MRLKKILHRHKFHPDFCQVCKCLGKCFLERMLNIDGHGVGVWGCAHPPKNLKSPDTPPCRRQGGCAPWCQRPRRKIFHAHPGGSIFSHFLAKSPRCLLNKPPNKKIIWHPCARAAAKIFWPPKAAENFFWTHPVCTHPPWPKTRAHLWYLMWQI